MDKNRDGEMDRWVSISCHTFLPSGANDNTFLNIYESARCTNEQPYKPKFTKKKSLITTVFNLNCAKLNNLAGQVKSFDAKNQLFVSTEVADVMNWLRLSGLWSIYFTHH